MSDESRTADDRAEGLAPRRLFIHEPGWRIGQKVGSIREFCYMIAPGQDFYHRLQDGELYLYHGDERICVACAQRRGLLAFEPKSLRDAPALIGIVGDLTRDEFDLYITGHDRQNDRTASDR
jgi:hypothetical protein